MNEIIMKNFFELLRRPKDRRVDPVEMEGFEIQEPERPQTQYTIEPTLIMPDMPERRTKLGDDLEGSDRGISLTEGFEPGTEISAEQTERLNQDATTQRRQQLVKRVAQMKDLARERAREMNPQTMGEYLDGLEEQEREMLQRAQELRENQQTDLAQSEEDEAQGLRAQVDVVRELLEAKRKAL